MAAFKFLLQEKDDVLYLLVQLKVSGVGIKETSTFRQLSSDLNHYFVFLAVDLSLYTKNNIKPTSVCPFSPY